jgi:hypothetical protein
VNENAQDINDTTQQNITIGNPLGFIENYPTESVSDQQKNINKVAKFLIDDDRTPLKQKEKII